MKDTITWQRASKFVPKLDKILSMRRKTIDDFDVQSDEDLYTLLDIIYAKGRKEPLDVVALALNAERGECFRLVKRSTFPISFRIAHGFIATWLSTHGFTSLKQLGTGEAATLRALMRDNGFCQRVITYTTKEAVISLDSYPGQLPTEGDLPVAEGILNRTCDFYGVSLGEVKGNGRHPMVVKARETASYLIREKTSLSFPDIARVLGRPNHSSIITMYQRVENLMTAGYVVVKVKGCKHMTMREILLYLGNEQGTRNGRKRTTQQSTTVQPAHAAGGGRTGLHEPEGRADGSQLSHAEPAVHHRAGQAKQVDCAA